MDEQQGSTATMVLVVLAVGLTANCGASQGNTGGPAASEAGSQDGTTSIQSEAGEGDDSSGNSDGANSDGEGGEGAVPDAAVETGVSSDAGDGSTPAQRGCPAASTGCYTVYAHTDRVLFYLDRVSVQLVEIGPFNAPQIPQNDSGTVEDVMTDLAVTPDGRVWLISDVNLYLADPMTGQATTVGPIAKCGMGNIALTSDASGTLYTADSQGALCRVDPTTAPPTLTQVGTLSNNAVISGDFVTVGDGTTYATTYNLSSAQSGSNNTLVTLTLANAASVQSIGATGFAKLFGVAYGGGNVLAFTGDGTGDVVTIDPVGGQGQLLASLIDPTTGKGAVFAGAGVDPRVSKTGP